MNDSVPPGEPPVGWATRSRYPPGYEPPPTDPQRRVRAEIVLGFYAASIGLFVAFLGRHQTAARIASLILSTAGMVVCAHGGRRLRRVHREAERALQTVPLAYRELTADERAAVAALPGLERRLFAHSIRYICDRAARPGNSIARNVKRYGVVAGSQLAVARQLMSLSGAVGWAGVLAVAAFDAANLSSPLTALTIAVPFIAAGLVMALAAGRIRAAHRLGKVFQSSGSPEPQLPPPTRPPVPVPKVWAIAAGAFALDAIGIGACFMTASTRRHRQPGSSSSSLV